MTRKGTGTPEGSTRKSTQTNATMGQEAAEHTFLCTNRKHPMDGSRRLQDYQI